MLGVKYTGPHPRLFPDNSISVLKRAKELLSAVGTATQALQLSLHSDKLR